MNTRAASPSLAGPISRPLKDLGSVLIGVVTFLALTGAQAATGQAPQSLDAQQVKQVQVLQSAVSQLAALREHANRVRTQSQQLGQAGARAQSAWNGYLTSQQKTRATLQSARECLPELQSQLDAIDSRVAGVKQAIEQSHTAIQSLAHADTSTRASAALRSNNAFAWRSRAEQDFEQGQAELQKMAAACSRQIQNSQWDLRREQSRAQSVAQQARALTQQHQALAAEWLDIVGRFSSIAKELPSAIELAPIPTLEQTGSDRVASLDKAVTALGWTDRSGMSLSASGAALAANRPNLMRLFTELARLEDATTYIDLSQVSQVSDCARSDCAGFAAERRDLALRTIETRQRLERAISDWKRSSGALAEQIPPLASAQHGTATAVAPVGALLPAVLEESTQASQTIGRAAEQVHSIADNAFARANDLWQSAHLEVYGSAPRPPAPPAQAAPEAAPVLAAPQLSAQAAMGQDIRSHAYDLFREFDDEIKGFGAYTYVLVRSAADLQQSSVKRRFQRLVTTLQKLPEATLVPEDQARHVNVFCIPVLPDGTRAGRTDPVPYSSELGHQIKLRAQNGLLTQATVHHRLTNSPGPFLLTLPSRLSMAKTDAPVLLADLATYPEDAIEDLATHYMNGLVDDFPSQQALWKPPVLQRVALFMIYLAEGTGQMVTSVMPTAQAEPR